MIAIDTNVLLRYLLWDKENQANKADAVVNGEESVLITDVVLVETVWTLRGRKYRLGKADLVSVLNALFAEPNISFEDDQATWRALQAYRTAKPVRVNKSTKEADFADALVVHKARSVASTRGERLTAVHSFDAGARRLPHTRAP